MNAFSLRASGRILWREAAEQYAFCIGVFALLITLQASWMTMEAFGMVSHPNEPHGFSMALFMTAIYGAASCALLLSAEVDAGTFVLHRTKPIGWFTFLWGKLSWTVLSTVLLGLVAWIETCVWLGVVPRARAVSFAFALTGVGILEGIAWGLIASMLFREPLRAVVGGITLASLGAWLTVALHRTVTGERDRGGHHGLLRCCGASAGRSGSGSVRGNPVGEDLVPHGATAGQGDSAADRSRPSDLDCSWGRLECVWRASARERFAVGLAGMAAVANASTHLLGAFLLSDRGDRGLLSAQGRRVAPS